MRAIWIVPVITSILILGTFTLVNSFSVPDSQKSTNQILEEYGKIPLSFEQNLGQTDSQVKFLSRGSGYTIFFTPDDVVMSLRSTSEDSSNQYITIEMSLIGVNPAQITGLEKQAGISNYFIGNDPQKWYTDIPNYANIKYTDVYSGIDLVYYGNQQKLEYDFVVAPGADPQNILFEINGADKLILDEGGNLIIETTDGQLIQHAPIIYQEINGKRQVIDGGYKLEENRIGFYISDYDNTLPLVIDPVLVYSTYLGGSNNDGGRAIAVDSSDNAYVTGNTRSTNFPTKNPIQAAHAGGVFDAFVTKINAAGNAHVYSTYLGGSGGDFGFSIAVDSSRNAYVTGETQSTNFPTKNPIQAAHAGGGDTFVTKINAAGNAHVYSTYLGGSSDDTGRGIAVDSSGNAYVTGPTGSTNFPTKNPIQAANAGSGDVYVTKINAAGNAHAYSTFLGGSGLEIGSNIAVDSSRNAYVTGETQSTDFPTTNPIQAAHAGGVFDAFVTKINAAGNAHAYSTYLGGSNNDGGRDIAVDLSGNAYVIGETLSTNFPTTNPIQAALAGDTDSFVLKIREVDTVSPVITLNGDPTVTLKVGIDTYTELGATVTDDDPAYTGTVTIGGDTVDPNTVGTYIVTYNAPADPSGNPAAQVTRTINVVDTTDTDGDGVTDSDEVNVYGTDPLDVDTDGDSLEDGWEIFGIDANSDGTIDLDLSSLGADPLHKDIFVEVDFMQLHQPNADAMNDLVTAFAISPVSNPDGLNGINLHIQVDNAMAHINCITVWSGFDSLKSALFGTSSQRADPNASNILAAKRLVYHYGLFVHGQCNTGYSGIGERPGDDFIISRGNSAAGHNSLINGRTQDAGIFMHEIGHNFGLRHGGGDIVNCKPNYLSTMKYNRMYPVYIPDRPLDYSREKIDDLVESNLDESKGVPSTSGLKTMYGPHIFPDISYKISLTGIAIDWNRDGDSEDSGVMADINLFVGIPDCSVAGLQTLTGFNDWSNLVYNFRTTNNFAPAEHQDPLDTPELTNEEIKAMQTMHVESLDQAIQNLSDESFTKPKVADARKKAFHNKLQAVTAMILADEFLDAIDKLTHDIRTKMDGSVGGNPKNDWIDPEAQAELIEILDNFVATLEKWLE